MSVIIQLPEAKEFLRITSVAVDTQVQLMLDSLEDWTERYCGIKFSQTSFTHYFNGNITYLRPFVGPVVSVTEVKDEYLGVTVSSSTYQLRNNRIYSQVSGGEPDEWEEGFDRWKVTYVAGYAEGAAPKGLILPMLYLLRRAYESRGVIRTATEGLTVEWDKFLEGDIGTLFAPFVMKEMC